MVVKVKVSLVFLNVAVECSSGKYLGKVGHTKLSTLLVEEIVFTARR